MHARGYCLSTNPEADLRLHVFILVEHREVTSGGFGRTFQRFSLRNCRLFVWMNPWAWNSTIRLAILMPTCDFSKRTRLCEKFIWGRPINSQNTSSRRGL